MIKKSLLGLTMGVALLSMGTAQAQMGSPMSVDGPAMHTQEQARHHKNDGNRMHKRGLHRMEKLKQSLKLSSDQNQAWATFEASLKSPGMQSRPSNHCQNDHPRASGFHVQNESPA